MTKASSSVFLFSVLLLSLCDCSDVFHESSKITFSPNYPADFFGYTVAFSKTGFIVGAPKATTQGLMKVSAGVVFDCSLQNLQTTNVTCTPMKITGQSNLKNGMWFGASLAVGPTGKAVVNLGLVEAGFMGHPINQHISVTDAAGNAVRPLVSVAIAVVVGRKLPPQKIPPVIAATLFCKYAAVICAPRLPRVHDYYDGENTKRKTYFNGACYLKMKRRESFLFPLANNARQWFHINNSRAEYLDYHFNSQLTSIKYYTLAQAGMAVKVTEDRIIIGAPGLLAWAGGIVQYTYNPDESNIGYAQKVTYNPYFTHDVRPDEYFGYSVESGVFEDGGNTLYVVGGPRAKRGFGMVLVFEPANEETAPLNILARLEGPQLGAYFGSSLSVFDINADGRLDLLVGAPNYVKQFTKDDSYDQGAVFVYLNTEQATGFVLEYAGRVTGSEVNGAKFGYSIADLGDVDGDGYNDVAVSAPWENNGAGVVYIYRGDRNGLASNYMQRIVPSEACGFGFGLAKGYDVDHNNCNDLVIGAYETGAVYLYRCIPTVKVQATIKLPEAISLLQNTTNFTAEFCVNVQPLKNYGTGSIKMELNATVTIDPQEERAMIAGNSTHLYVVSAAPSSDNCEVKIIEIKPAADLSRPIRIIFNLEPIDKMLENPSQFKTDAGRVSADSILHSFLDIQLLKECGKDLICTPWLEMEMKAINEPYIPGSDGRLGAIVTVLNKEEPAFGIKINFTLPSLPKRVPNTCFLRGLNMTCNLPSPFYQNETATWEVELENTRDMVDMGLTMIEANVIDPVKNRNISENASQYLEITVMPMANISVSGHALPNVTLAVTREQLNEGRNISAVHYFQVSNAGPSDWYELSATITITGKVSLDSKGISGCNDESWDSSNMVLACTWTLNAMQSLPVVVPLRYDLEANGKSLNADAPYNIISTLFLEQKNKSLTLTTTLVLEPSTKLWIFLVAAATVGLLLVAVLSYSLYKCGFFSRRDRQELLEQLKNMKLLEEPEYSSIPPSDSELVGANESNVEDPTQPSCSYRSVVPSEFDSCLPSLSFQGPSTENNQTVELFYSSPTSISEATAVYTALRRQLSDANID